jgi:hypothetical protein
MEALPIEEDGGKLSLPCWRIGWEQLNSLTSQNADPRALRKVLTRQAVLAREISDW